LSALLALLVLVASLWLPVQVKTPQDMISVGHGYPIHFVFQDLRKYDPPPDSYPRKFHIYSPWETPTEIRWVRLVASYVIIVFILEGIFVLAASVIVVFGARDS
jgi:hypothetical protein